MRLAASHAYGLGGKERDIGIQPGAIPNAMAMAFEGVYG